jgi:hypothetical protein
MRGGSFCPEQYAGHLCAHQFSVGKMLQMEVQQIYRTGIALVKILWILCSKDISPACAGRTKNAHKKSKWEQKPHLFAHWQQCTWFCNPFKGVKAH